MARVPEVSAVLKLYNRQAVRAVAEKMSGVATVRNLPEVFAALHAGSLLKRWDTPVLTDKEVWQAFMEVFDWWDQDEVGCHDLKNAVYAHATAEVDARKTKLLGHFSGPVVMQAHSALKTHQAVTTDRVARELVYWENTRNVKNPAHERDEFFADFAAARESGDCGWRNALEDYAWNHAANCGD